MGRYARRVDENQADIVRELREAGVAVQDLSRVGEGVPDIVCGWQDRNYLFEIKNPGKPKADQKLTVAEISWHDRWKGQVTIIWSAHEALVLMGVIDGDH